MVVLGDCGVRIERNVRECRLGAEPPLVLGCPVLDRPRWRASATLAQVTSLGTTADVGNFLAEPYLDTDKALKKALHPITRRQEAARTFVKEFRVDWHGADRFVRWLHDHGLRWLLPSMVITTASRRSTSRSVATRPCLMTLRASLSGPARRDSRCSSPRR